jgi:hypothetical protein
MTLRCEYGEKTWNDGGPSRQLILAYLVQTKRAYRIRDSLNDLETIDENTSFKSERKLTSKAGSTPDSTTL